MFDLAIDTLDGDVGMILGADDLLDQYYLQEMAKAWLLNPTAVLVHPRVKIIDERSSAKSVVVDYIKFAMTPFNFRKVICGRVLLYSLIPGNWMYFTASTFRIDALKKFRFKPELKITMDWDIAFRFAFAELKFAYCREAKFYYRRHSNSFSMKKESSSERLAEELYVIKNAGSAAKHHKMYDVWLLSKLHFFSQVNYILRKFS
jgi:hypothetical protein